MKISPLLFKQFVHATVGQHMQDLLKLSWQLTGQACVRSCCLRDVESSQDWSELKAAAESYTECVWKLSAFFLLSFHRLHSPLTVGNWGAGKWRRGNQFQLNIRIHVWMAVSWMQKPQCNVVGNGCLIFSVTPPKPSSGAKQRQNRQREGPNITFSFTGNLLCHKIVLCITFNWKDRILLRLLGFSLYICNKQHNIF